MARKKPCASYSRPFDLRRYDPSVGLRLWIRAGISPGISTKAAHYPLITARQAKHLRKRDIFEQRIGAIVEVSGIEDLEGFYSIKDGGPQLTKHGHFWSVRLILPKRN